jgi:hypothetical protein
MKVVGAMAMTVGPITAAAMAPRRVAIAVTATPRYCDESEVLNSVYSIEVK